jgi:2-polyprenyl-6-hydroxyphenyl methylase/3-demethylubiquinone-9 3-methyltransferase
MGIVLADYADRLTKAVTDPDPAVAKRAFDAMMQMKKIDIAAIEAARRG